MIKDQIKIDQHKTKNLQENIKLKEKELERLNKKNANSKLV